MSNARRTSGAQNVAASARTLLGGEGRRRRRRRGTPSQMGRDVGDAGGGVRRGPRREGSGIGLRPACAGGGTPRCEAPRRTLRPSDEAREAQGAAHCLQRMAVAATTMPQQPAACGGACHQRDAAHVIAPPPKRFHSRAATRLDFPCAAVTGAPGAGTAATSSSAQLLIHSQRRLRNARKLKKNCVGTTMHAVSLRVYSTP